MTWLGKILTVVVFLGVLLWAYFTVQSYALRTNWKVEAEKYKDAYTKAVAARQSEYDRYRASEDTIRRQLVNEQTRSEGLNKQIASFGEDAKRAGTVAKEFQDQLAQLDVKAIKLEAELQARIAELQGVRARNKEVEDDRLRLVIAAETARREMVRAQNSEKLTQAIADENSRKAEDLQARIGDLKAGGGSGASGAVMRAINKPPAPVLENLRGEVKDVAGDLVTITVGIDAGMGVGTVLDVYRTEGGGRYLGKVRVTSAYNLYAKESVVTFTPARNVPIERLTPEELPRKGDVVRPPAALGNGQ
jgi:hypothetical protein